MKPSSSRPAHIGWKGVITAKQVREGWWEQLQITSFDCWPLWNDRKRMDAIRSTRNDLHLEGSASSSAEN